MVVKFFSNKSGGSSKALDYLLNHREEEGSARVLQGNSLLTRKLINSISFKQKVTVGCLSFEEKNIDEKLKYTLIQEFEYILLPSMKKRVNFLWVEHTDKNRLELNFVIPKMDLLTQKSINPYFHKVDLSRIEAWQDLQNLKYNFSNPKDPAKVRTLEIDSKHQNLVKDFQKLDELLHSLVSKGQIKNRNQLIELCSTNNIAVTYIVKNYLYLKLPNAKKSRKFKGGIYNEQFRSIAELRTISKRTREEIIEYNRRNPSNELEYYIKRLEYFTREKIEYIEKRYPLNRGKKSNFNEENYEQYRKTNHTKSRREIYKNHTSNNGCNIFINNHFNSISSLYNYKYRSKKIKQWRVNKDLLLLDNKSRGELNDSTRTTIIERIRNKREAIEQNIHGIQREGELSNREIERSNKKLYTKLRINSKCVYSKIRESDKKSREQHIEDKKRLPRSNTKFNTTIEEAYARCRNYRREWEELLGAIEGVKELNRMVESASETIARRVVEENQTKMNIENMNF